MENHKDKIKRLREKKIEIDKRTKSKDRKRNYSFVWGRNKKQIAKAEKERQSKLSELIFTTQED